MHPKCYCFSSHSAISYRVVEFTLLFSLYMYLLCNDHFVYKYILYLMNNLTIVALSNNWCIQQAFLRDMVTSAHIFMGMQSKGYKHVKLKVMCM